MTISALECNADNVTQLGEFINNDTPNGNPQAFVGMWRADAIKVFAQRDITGKIDAAQVWIILPHPVAGGRGAALLLAKGDCSKVDAFRQVFFQALKADLWHALQVII